MIIWQIITDGVDDDDAGNYDDNDDRGKEKKEGGARSQTIYKYIMTRILGARWAPTPTPDADLF